MKKADISTRFRSHVRSQLSLTPDQRTFVSSIYDSVGAALGRNTCIQIGSYARFTSIRPIHDLDVLYEVGSWDEAAVDPASVLNELSERLRTEYRNPTKYVCTRSLQSHSVTLTFLDGREEVFSVDIVPAYSQDSNEFGSPMYMVPEIVTRGRRARRQLYEDIAGGRHEMLCIETDPRGYNEVARRINATNSDFRLSVKFTKGWRQSCKEKHPGFALKSFHLEQIITGYFIESPETSIFDAVFKFFCELPSRMEKPSIPDRANKQKNIDDYVAQLSEDDRRLIAEARDCFLLKLEQFDETSSAADLLSACTRRRAGISERFLFDYGIPVLTEEPLRIQARVLQRDGFRERLLGSGDSIEAGRNIDFRVAGAAPAADIFKWKVKNDDLCGQPRGEINDHRTSNDPERTKYSGTHYVECYAIRDGVCVAKARKVIVIR